MSNKILSISIAAYNVAQYIEECIKSIINCKFVDLVEVFVVDDGATDNTLDLARKYQDLYPQSIKLIHKENGGYGSTVNYSIQHSTGKYFKLLDGDDWFDVDGLNKLIKYLITSDSDLVITNVLKGSSRFNMKVMDYATENRNAPKSGKLCSIVGHWGLTYKTSVLKNSKMVLPSHCLYTDKIYSTIPFSLVDKIDVLNFPVYCYRVGRDGQSISRESRIKHVDEYCYVSEMICNYCKKHKIAKDSYIFMRALNSYQLSIKTILLLKINSQNKKRLIKFENKFKNNYNEIYTGSSCNKTKSSKVIAFLRKTKYLGYWCFIFVPKKLIDF